MFVLFSNNSIKLSFRYFFVELCFMFFSIQFVMSTTKKKSLKFSFKIQLVGGFVLKDETKLILL